MDQFYLNTLNKAGNDLVAKTIVSEKKKFIEKFDIHYQNRFKITTKESNTLQSTFTISNIRCQKIDNSLKKITIIKIGDRQFHIQEVITIKSQEEGEKQKEVDPQLQKNTIDSTTNQSEKSSESQTNQSQNDDINDKYNLKTKNKLNLFKRSRHQKNQSSPKNTVKNLCKAFINSLKEQNILLKSPLISEFNQLVMENHYNNKLIQSIIANQELSSLFSLFLQNQAMNWIQNSRVSNKQIHKKAIKIYSNLFPIQKK